MKIRNGFVSNSSSSSFTLALPKGTKKEDVKEIILKKMQVPDTSMIFSIAQNMAELFAEGIDQQLDIDEEIKDTKRYLKDYPSTDGWEKDWIKELEGYKEKEWVVFRGGFSNNGTTGVEMMLCYWDLTIIDDDIHFENSGGY